MTGRFQEAPPNGWTTNAKDAEGQVEMAMTPEEREQMKKGSERLRESSVKVSQMPSKPKRMRKIEVVFRYIEAAELFCLRAEMHEELFAEVSEPEQRDIREVACTISVEADKMSAERFWELVSEIAGPVNHSLRRWVS